MSYPDPSLRQYSALVIDAQGVQRMTLVTARSSIHAREQLMALGYTKIFWVL